MKISVILVTYNQEQYIRQAIESILMQRFNGEVVVIVADDSSTDKTLDIIKSYETISPYEFEYCDSKVNLGLVKNYQRAFNVCSGNYIAVLEGDDYWTDPLRLQKHVDFLENHIECMMSYNRNLIYLQNTEKILIDNENINTGNKYITAQNLAAGNCIGNFSKCVYRKSIIEKLNPEIYNMNIADWMINLCVAQYGLIAQLGEIMSVYRIHVEGEWSIKSKLSKLKMEFECAETYNKFFEYRYNDEFSSLQRYIKSEIDKIENKKQFNWKTIKRYLPPILILFVKLFIPKWKTK